MAVGEHLRLPFDHLATRVRRQRQLPLQVACGTLANLAHQLLHADGMRIASPGVGPREIGKDLEQVVTARTGGPPGHGP